ncbi:MAG TPA: TolC family protein [Oceanipulchritudo sp.]|nr:TolC family protein [Oceanipulchritudo sp.]
MKKKVIPIILLLAVAGTAGYFYLRSLQKEEGAELTVRPLDDLQKDLQSVQQIPRLDGFVGNRIDSSTLQQRPDIRIAESRIEQANAELGAHISNLYPRFILVGSLGLESIDANTFTDSASRLWRLGPTITLPILKGGALRQQVAAAEATLQIRVAEYQQEVLNALRESEAALIRFNKGQEEAQHSSLAFGSAEDAYRIALIQYETGVLPLDRLLSFQTSQLAARDQLAQAEGNAAISLIRLGKALGGSWELSY